MDVLSYFHLMERVYYGVIQYLSFERIPYPHDKMGKVKRQCGYCGTSFMSDRPINEEAECPFCWKVS